MSLIKCLNSDIIASVRPNDVPPSSLFMTKMRHDYCNVRRYMRLSESHLRVFVIGLSIGQFGSRAWGFGIKWVDGRNVETQLLEREEANTIFTKVLKHPSAYMCSTTERGIRKKCYPQRTPASQDLAKGLLRYRV
jgi:hypothetical protein